MNSRHCFTLACTILLLTVAPTPLQAAQVIGTFTGGDTGEGLDLEGDFFLAVNMGADATSYTLNNDGTSLVFLSESSATATGRYSTDGNSTYSAGLPNYGSNANDSNLELMTRTGRYEAQLPNPVDFNVTLSDLTPGTPYKLQLLFHEPSTTAIGVRQFNVLIPGADPIINFDPVAYGSGNSGEYLKNGVVIAHDFVASSSSLTVSFTKGLGNVPYVNGVTVERNPDPAILSSDNPDLVLRLKADAGVRDAAGLAPTDAGFSGSVATWLDQSGKGNNVTQATIGSQPSYVSTVADLQNKPALHVDGGDSLVGTLDTDPNTPGVQPLATDFTVIGVIQYDSGTSARAWLGGGYHKLAFGSGNFPSIAPLDSFWAWTPGYASTYGLEGSLNTDWNMHSYVIPSLEESDWQWYLNGPPTGGAVLTAETPQQYSGNIYVGHSGYSGEYWIGDIAEIMVFNSALTLDQLNEIGFYLEEKYGIAYAAVPEPSAFALLLLGGLALLARGRSRRRD